MKDCTPLNLCKLVKIFFVTAGIIMKLQEREMRSVRVNNNQEDVTIRQMLLVQIHL